jgi:hypothetical protein
VTRTPAWITTPSACAAASPRIDVTLLAYPPRCSWRMMAGVVPSSDEGLLSVFDSTHGRALMRLEGDHAADLLAKVYAIDLTDDVTPNGAAFRSSVAKLFADVVRDPRASTSSTRYSTPAASGTSGRRLSLGLWSGRSRAPFR